MCLEKMSLVKQQLSFCCTMQQFRLVERFSESIKNLSDARKYETFVYFTKIKVATLSINKIIPVSIALAMPQVEESQKKSSKDHNNEEKVGPNRRFFFTSPLDSLFGKVHKE